jgi:hypothetical protein
MRLPPLRPPIRIRKLLMCFKSSQDPWRANSRPLTDGAHSVRFTWA